MKNLFRATIAAGVCLYGFGSPWTLTAQPTVTLVGIVRVNGQTDAKDVAVVATYGNQRGQVRHPFHDIFVYPVPEGAGSVRLTFARAGYEAKYIEYPLVDRSFAIRLQPDVELQKIEEYELLSSGATSGEEERTELRRHLESQAGIAERAGAEVQKIFQWNLSSYEMLLKNNAVLSAELQVFKQSPRFQNMTSPRGAARLDLYRQLQPNTTSPQTIPSNDLLELVRDQSEPGPIRAAALNVLRQSSLSAQDRIRTLEFIRGTVSRTASPALLEAGYAGLATLGSSADMESVRKVLQTGDETRVIAAAVGMNRARVSGADGIFTRTMLSHRDPGVRAALIERVGEHVDGLPALTGAVAAMSVLLASDSVVSVRVAAARALHSLQRAGLDSVAARLALSAALLDTTNVEVRAEARRLVRKPPE